MKTALIQTAGLSKTYRVGNQQIHALVDVSVDISNGEFVAVMGPSGSGKSTFMNLLGCLDTPSAGEYRLEGRMVSKLSPMERAAVRNRRLGFVFQSFNLLPRTTALENVALPLRYAGERRRQRAEIARTALAAVGLGDRWHHHPAQLSGGQQQRVAIARAVVGKPALILADEPTGALDTRTGIEVMALFQRLNRQGMTIVVVTHEIEVATFAGRLLRFRDGCLEEDKTVQNPADAQQLLACKAE